MRRIDRQARREKQELARELRRRSTPAEARLWKELRTNKLDGVHFRRQHVLAGFIVDFYCVEARLVIELDGKHHHEQQEADREREAVLLRMGNTVLRFSNAAIQSDFRSDLATIRETVRDRTRPGVPLPRFGEGDRG